MIVLPVMSFYNSNKRLATAEKAPTARAVVVMDPFLTRLILRAIIVMDINKYFLCLVYTSDAAEDSLRVEM